MVSLALLGLPKSWHSYQNLINGREKLLSWESLCSHLVQEEIGQNTKDGTSSKGEDVDNYDLDGKEKKWKGKKYKSKEESGQRGKNKDLSRIKCFHCHEFKHYAMKCPHKNESKKTIGVAGEALASQFKLDFTLIACMFSIVMGSVWYLDNGASFHMMGNKGFLVIWRRRISGCTSRWEMMEGTS